jgi:5-formyltetrahydrofolate cyclo-ligase
MDTEYTSEALDREKQTLRRRFLEERMALSLESRLQAGREIGRLCHDFIGEQSARYTLCFYRAVKNEPDILPLARAMLLAGRRVAFPAIAEGKIVYREVNNFEEDFTAAAFGILEPKGHCPSISENEECIVFIPGLAFDRTGTRLGYGKGYFDRWLARRRVTSVGVTYDAAILPHIPKGGNDHPVRSICSERRFLQAATRDEGSA